MSISLRILFSELVYIVFFYLQNDKRCSLTVTFSRLEPEGKLIMGCRKASVIPSFDQVCPPTSPCPNLVNDSLIKKCDSMFCEVPNRLCMFAFQTDIFTSLSIEMRKLHICDYMLLCSHKHVHIIKF